jgi:hypothetical protein
MQLIMRCCPSRIKKSTLISSRSYLSLYLLEGPSSTPIQKQAMFWSSTTRICCCTHEGFTQATYTSTATSTLGGMNRCTTTSTMSCASATSPPSAATSSSSHTGFTSPTSCVRSLRLAARLLVVQIALALLRLCRASGRVVSTLDFSSFGHTGSRSVPGHSIVRRDYPSRGRNGYTSHTLRVRVPWLVAPLVVDYFAYVVRPGASARRAALRQLLHLHSASGCLGTSRGSSRHSSSTSTTPLVRVPRLVAQLIAPLVVDYFAYAARLGASARRTTHCAARRRLLRLAQARRRLLRLRRASGCHGTSCGSSRRSSSTTSPTPHERVPRHIARLVAPLAVDYFAYAARPGASARRAARHVARRRLLRAPRLHTGSTSATTCVATTCGNTGSTSSTPHAAATSSSGRIASNIHLD